MMRRLRDYRVETFKLKATARDRVDDRVGSLEADAHSQGADLGRETAARHWRTHVNGWWPRFAGRPARSLSPPALAWRGACGFALILAVAACSVGNPETGSSSQSTVGSLTAQSEQDAYISVVKTVAPSVVEIATDSGLGSGVVFDNQGNIVTNSHVVGNAQQVEVTTADGKRFEGVVVYSYPPDDLAVVRVTQARLKPATFADSSKVQVGEIVLAIGNPLGLQSSVTEGIVSATGRVVNEGSNITLPDTIQTSAAINPGNSGGALVNLKSEVIGIPTLAAISPANIGGQAPGIGFAISSNRVKSIASQIVRDGRVTNSERAYLGIQAADTTSGGVLVKAVVPGGPAAKAGIEPGELITAVAGDATLSSSRLSQVLATLQPNQAVPVNVRAGNGEMRIVNVLLGEYPGS